MNLLKKSMIAAGIAAGLLVVSPAKSASLNVDTDVTVPDVLILYAYTDIDLSFGAGEFAALLDGSCTSEDCGSAISAAEAGTITGGVTDLDIATDLAATGTTASITIQNSWAVRALGYGTFTASVADNGSETAVSGLTVAPTTGTPSMTATTGDVSFDIDLTSSDLDDGLIEANYTITVTGS
ncbi:hypothetical protein [Kangiella sediminilitoris]|uniref:Uncharacterized protein n=1 Tax=Kangiella sediminilitoris TaxID=1144748 RepID=A0A1B3B8F5_9GAMM|nr:hypothetical protein [Kangiella sediminilitoris]AOE49083.1 hypothetical protein KS2013_358 [Kangiella sediminilitoris]